MSDIINQCKICGRFFPSDAKWKTTCYKCWLKKTNPKRYKEQFELIDLICERCGQDFVDEGWKTLCFRCWIQTKNEEAMNDFEEREQYDK